MAQSSVESAFAAYVKLTADEKRQFDAMKAWQSRPRSRGKKSAATKKAKAATTAEA